MNKNCETICDSNGIEILVSYYWQKTKSQVEEGHGYHEVGLMIYTELVSVELVIAGRGIELIKELTENEKEFIIGKLLYE